jgi:hypothetical protein
MKTVSRFLLLVSLLSISLSCSSLPKDRTINSVDGIEKVPKESQREIDRRVRQNLMHQMNRGEFRSFNRR